MVYAVALHGKRGCGQIRQILTWQPADQCHQFTFAERCFSVLNIPPMKLSVKVIDTRTAWMRKTLNRIFRPFERAAQEVNSEEVLPDWAHT